MHILVQFVIYRQGHTFSHPIREKYYYYFYHVICKGNGEEIKSRKHKEDRKVEGG